MMRIASLLCAALFSAAAWRAQFCNPAGLFGPYAFQLTGLTSISGSPQPTASLGRVFLDGNGDVSGVASVKFSGLLLGNPVTGTYDAKWDCSIVWQLQDDSGHFQNFRGAFSPVGGRVQFQQTDPGGAQNGTMKKTADSCSAANLKKKYSYTIAGNTTPMKPGDVPYTVSAEGAIDIAQNGTFSVDSDCSVQFAWTLPARDAPAVWLPIHMRGFPVNEGKEILAFQTDPGSVVAAHLTWVPDH